MTWFGFLFPFVQCFDRLYSTRRPPVTIPTTTLINGTMNPVAPFSFLLSDAAKFLGSLIRIDSVSTKMLLSKNKDVSYAE